MIVGRFRVPNTRVNIIPRAGYMNKYDDIKRFIEKSKTEDIDYKEINEKSTGNGMTGSMNKWALIKQVSASEEAPGALDNGRTTQPTPQAISVEEFQRSAALAQGVLNTPLTAQSVAPAVPTSVNALSSAIAPVSGGLMEAVRESLPQAPQPQAPSQAPAAQASLPHSAAILHAQSVTPDSTGSLLDSVKHVLPAQPEAPEPKPVYTAPVATPVRPAPVWTQPVAAAVPAPAAGAPFRQMFKQKAPPSAGAFLHRDTPLQPLLEMIASCR